jgi:hypothetical protein
MSRKTNTGTFHADDLECFDDKHLIDQARGDAEKIGWYQRMVALLQERYPEEQDFSKWQVWRVLNALTTN